MATACILFWHLQASTHVYLLRSRQKQFSHSTGLTTYTPCLTAVAQQNPFKLQTKKAGDLRPLVLLLSLFYLNCFSSYILVFLPCARLLQHNGNSTYLYTTSSIHICSRRSETFDARGTNATGKNCPPDRRSRLPTRSACCDRTYFSVAARSIASGSIKCIT